jgi:cell division protein FtsI/penicillin-binding protein 2
MVLTVLGILFSCPATDGTAHEIGGAAAWVRCEPSAGRAGTRNSLFAQSAARLLDDEFRSDEVSFLLLDARTGLLLASRWDNPEGPIPFGSLVKPFTALAYAERHGFSYPTHFCKGTTSGCWLPSGHGNSTIETAIANSCNSYFRMLAANLSGEDVGSTANSFGLEVPRSELSGPALCGLGNDWLISPVHMARAYLELSRRRDQPGVREVLAGMAESARQGTGSEAGRALKHCDALVKTGTAACTHRNRAPGDGFVVALVPAEQPDLLLLVRVHGVPGAKASTIAGRMLSRLEE